MSTRTAGSIDVIHEGPIATVMINHPGRRNALTREMCVELARLLPVLDADVAVKVIALRGAGQDFCAGAALHDLEGVLFDGYVREAGGDAGANDRRSGIDRLSEADAAIKAVRKPTVSLVRGICMGGGWQIAAACDVLLAADDLRLAITPAKLGILYPQAGVERLVQRVGEDRAKYLLFTASEISPATAAAWGLVTELVPADDFEAVAAAVLEGIANRSQYSIVTMKELISVGGPDAARSAWAQAWQAFPENKDLATGRAAFAAKAPPEFSWRVPAIPTPNGI